MIKVLNHGKRVLLLKLTFIIIQISEPLKINQNGFLPLSTLLSRQDSQLAFELQKELSHVHSNQDEPLVSQTR